MRVPAIGEQKGIFEIFVPGGFLLLNIAGMSLTFLQKKYVALSIKSLSGLGVGGLGISIIIIICFSYLFGMLVRLLMTETPDKVSAWYHRCSTKRAKRKEWVSDSEV